MTNVLSLFRQICRFGIVGLAAAAVHFTTVLYLVQANLFAPLVANVLAFALGFQISYWGHSKWTFKASHVLHQEAMPKLLTVQALNFAANELLFYLFLSFNVPYPIALIIVLTILPLFTFASSKWWVFR